jgi:hypothetical protein
LTLVAVYRHIEDAPVVEEGWRCPNIGQELRLPVETSADGVWTYDPKVPRCSECGCEPAPIERVETWSTDGAGA